MAALAGPNGAGKTTLMHMAVGLIAPTEGRVTVLGGRPAGSREALERVAFVAQDVPLYRHLPVEDMMRLARVLNASRWDQSRAERRLAAMDIPLRRKVGKLSGGQQAQVALTIALARRPELLVLDEPLAPLDPLARHEFLAAVMETAAEDGTSVLFSSHVVTELERVADYLVVLSRGRVQVAGDVEDLVRSHQLLTGPAGGVAAVGDRFDVVHAQQGLAQAHLLVRQPAAPAQPSRAVDAAAGRLAGPAAGRLAGPSGDAGGSRARVPARAGSLRAAGSRTGGDLMTALTSDAPQAGRWRRARPRPRGLAELAWAVGRPHRTTLIWLGLWLLASATGMLVAGIRLHRLYAAEIQHGCLGRSAWSGVCRPLQSTFGLGWPQAYTLQAILYLQVVPVIIGVFAGAPLLAGEYTAGTVRFAWTQGIGRTRWAVATLGLLASAVAVVACLLGLLLQWSLLPVAAQTSRFADRWEPGVFNATPLTAATAAVLAFAIGVLAGALIRRVVAAMAVTAVATITVANLMYNRLHYWLLGQGLRQVRDLAFGANGNVGIPSAGPIDIHETVGRSVPGPAGAWLDQGWYTGPDGHRLSNGAVTALLNKHAGTGSAWLTRLHDSFWVSYQPASRYWVFQLILAGGTLLAAAALAVATIALIRHRRA